MQIFRVNFTREGGCNVNRYSYSMSMLTLMMMGAIIFFCLRQRQPFSSLSSKEANILNILKQAIEIQNKELALNNISQIADEIEFLEKNLHLQTRRVSKSYIISTIGLVLTSFFGFMSFLQFFIRW